MEKKKWKEMEFPFRHKIKGKGGSEMKDIDKDITEVDGNKEGERLLEEWREQKDQTEKK